MDLAQGPARPRLSRGAAGDRRDRPSPGRRLAAHGSVSLGGIAGLIAALAFVFLVFRLGELLGKAGKILDETTVSLRTTSENVQPTLLKLTDTVSLTNDQLTRVDGITTNVSAMTTNATALTSLFAATLGTPAHQGRGVQLRRALGRCAGGTKQRRRPSPPQGLITVARLFWVGARAPQPVCMPCARSARPPRPTRRPGSRDGLADFGDGLRELAAAVREGMAEREGELRLAAGHRRRHRRRPRGRARLASTPRRRGRCSTTPRAARGGRAR